MDDYNWSQEERDEYIKCNIAITDEHEARRHEREEGHKEGHKEGRIEIIRSLLKHGLAIKQISEATGLNIDEISEATGLNIDEISELEQKEK